MKSNTYKVLPKFPNYRIYADGRIQIIQKTYYHPPSDKHLQNHRYLRFIKPRVHPIWGMLFTNINDKDGNQVTVHIHKIVAKAFIPNPKKKNRVWFKDGNKKNVLVSNLYWCTQGDLNRIQAELGTRDMVKQAEIMRQRRPKKYKRGRVSGGKIVKGKYKV